jgi:hypothetical protein
VQTDEVDGISASDLTADDLARAASQFLRDVEPELIGRAVAPRKRVRQLDGRSKLVGR